ncbi:MAG TPA: response regulator transcription factor [Caulobacteraceae bacterium]
MANGRAPDMVDSANFARILIVEDDIICREIVGAHLKSEGFHTVEAVDIASGVTAFATHPIDLLITDINLPDGLGFDLVQTLRRQRDFAAIYMTSRGGSCDRVRGLEDGGDDYIVKPVDMPELTARVRAVLRRYRKTAPGPAPSESVVVFAGWTLDLVRRELADSKGGLIRLTRAEFDLFAALAQTGAKPLSRDYLVEVVSSADSATRERTIDVMISRIRRKLALANQPAPQIVTELGAGYRFKAPEPLPA